MRCTQTFLLAALAASASAFSLTDIEPAREAETPAACFKALSTDIAACSTMKVGGTCTSDCSAALKALAPKLSESCSTAFGNPGSLIRRLQDGFPLVDAVCGATKSTDDAEVKEDDKKDAVKEDDKKDEDKPEATSVQQSAKLEMPMITRPAVTASGKLLIDVSPTPTPKAEADAAEEEEDKSMNVKDVTSTAGTSAKETASVTESASTTEATQEAAETEEDPDADSAAGKVYIASSAMGLVAFAAAWLL